MHKITNRTERMTRLTLIPVVYFLGSIIIMLLVDEILFSLTHNIDTYMRYQTYKDIGFISLTLGFMYLLLKKETVEKNKAEQQREQLLHLIFDSIPDFVNLKNGQGRWIFANQVAIRFFDMEESVYRGRKDTELAPYCRLSYSELLHCEQTDEEAWQNGTETHFEETFNQPDGSVRTFDVIKIPMFHSDGRRKCLLVISRDITIRKQVEDIIEEAHTLNVIGELAAGVAHEIRNPLTSIKGFTQLFQREATKDEAYIQIMLSELKQIEDIIDEFLMMSKPQQVRYQTVHIASLIDKAMMLVSTHATLKNIEIHSDCDLEIPAIQCEPNHLKQVFINIVKNAIESMEDGGSITITARKKGIDEIMLSFADSGCGIPKEKIQKIGQPFYTTKDKGTGLGLMVSYNIIKNHCGRIEIESEAGKGTTFHVILPIYQNKNGSAVHN